MGFFDLFNKGRQLTRMIEAGGNYAFIAQNMACIYNVVNEDARTRFLPEKNRLLATAIFDLMGYLKDGELELMDIEWMMSEAEVGAIAVGFNRKPHSGLTDTSEYKDLVNLTMQVETSIFFLAEPDLGGEDIMQSVLQRKDLITKVIEGTIAEGQQCRLYNDVRANIDLYLSDPDLIKYLGAYK